MTIYAFKRKQNQILIYSTVVSFIFVNVHFRILVENEMFIDICIHGFNTCKLLLLQGSPHIVKTGWFDFSLSWHKGEVRENLGDFRKSITILTFLGEKNYWLEKTDRVTKTSLFDRNWAISLKPRWKSRPLRSCINSGHRAHDQMVVGFTPAYVISLSPLMLWVWILLMAFSCIGHLFKVWFIQDSGLFRVKVYSGLRFIQG